MNRDFVIRVILGPLVALSGMLLYSNGHEVVGILWMALGSGLITNKT